MLLSLLSMMFLLLSIIFYISSNPLSMGILVLLIALTSTLIISLLMSSWLCFLVFLIYIGGMLVLFSYFVAITPNIPMPSLMMNLAWITISPSLMIMMLMYPSSVPANVQPDLYIQFMYSMTNYPTLIMLALVLLLTMIIVIKLVSMKAGPLRPFNSYV